jgi:hypothetical protein
VLDLLITLVSLEGAALIGLIGFSFKTRADAQGWKTSYEREKERSEAYVAAERDTKLAVEIGARVAEALGRLPLTPKKEES